MSNIYIQEPPTTGKVLLKTSVGDIDLELWTKEAPKACRNFIQLCMEDYYNGTIFHRIVKGFIAQGGDPTGTGEGGESIYGQPFKDEFHTRLRFCRRGLLAMANAGKDDNASQFFFTFSATPELQNKHTIFGKVTGETIYNMLKLEGAIVDANERPTYPQKILKTEVLLNPFQDIVPRSSGRIDDDDTDKKKKEKKSGVKNFKLLSFGEEAEEDEEESVVLNKQYSGKGKSAHDNLSDPKLSSTLAIEPSGPPRKKRKEDRSSDWESGDETQTAEDKKEAEKASKEMKDRIIKKLHEKKASYASMVKKPVQYDKKPVVDESEEEKEEEEEEEEEEEKEEDEYYLGKDRHDERKKKAEAIRKEINDLKKGVRNEKRAKEESEKKIVEKAKKNENKSELMNNYKKTQEKYKDEKLKVPKKGASRESFTAQLLMKFRSKLQSVKGRDENGEESQGGGDKSREQVENKDNENDESWMTHTLQCEEEKPVLAKDASTKDDDWFEIYDPRNPINKRRRGENSSKSKSSSGRGGHRRPH